MITKKMIKTLSLYFIATILAASCTFTTTKIKNPTFNRPIDSLQIDLNKIVTCENFNINGKEISTNGKVSSELEIDITNGQNIPDNGDEMDRLGKQVAVIIKAALQDKNQFDTYKVLFVTKKQNGNLTERTWKGKVFKVGEL